MACPLIRPTGAHLWNACLFRLCRQKNCRGEGLASCIDPTAGAQCEVSSIEACPCEVM
jgi:hypothetical protein